MPRLQFKEKLSVRQYIISDPSTVFYTEYSSSVKVKQQMRTSPTQFHTSDHRSDGLDSTTNYTCPLPSKPDNPYYIDPDYGVDPFWDIQLYNQHYLLFYSNFTKANADIEPDCPVTNRALNDVLSKALVDA